MKQILLTLLLGIMFCLINSCTTPIEPMATESCLIKFENIDSVTSGFLIFESDNQTKGVASGTKINLPFEASAILLPTSSQIPFYTIDLFTRWNTGELAERLLLNELPLEEPIRCFELTDNKLSVDSVFINYIVRHEDVQLPISYKLNNKETNKLEVINFDGNSNSVEAIFNASFKADTALLPEFPMIIDFINVHVIIQN